MDSNKLKDKLIKLDSINQYKNEIILFLDRIKSDKELNKNRKELVVKRNRLNKLEKINIRNKGNNKYNIEIRKQIKLNNKNNKLIIELDKVILKKKYEKYSNRIKELEIELDILDYNKMLLNKQIIKHNENIRNQVCLLEDDLCEKECVYNTFKYELSSKEKNLSELKTSLIYEKKEYYKIKNDFEKKIKIENKIKLLENKNIFYKEYKRLVDKKCLPAIILKNKIKYIENDINNNLEDLVKFKIRLSVTDKSKFQIEILKHNNVLLPYMCSGYERFILNVVIKKSLNKYCYNNKSNLFCIDEGLDCIDQYNIKKFNILLERLRYDYKNILLISHIERIKKFINNEIVIKHENNSSLIC